MTAFYTAQLTAVLTTQERRLPVSTLHELQVRDCFRLSQISPRQIIGRIETICPSQSF